VVAFTWQDPRAMPDTASPATVTAQDLPGNEVTGTATCIVPHDSSDKGS
jgi:hypothetical protein